MQITRCSIDMRRIVKGLYLVSQIFFYNCQEKWLQIGILRTIFKTYYCHKTLEPLQRNGLANEPKNQNLTQAHLSKKIIKSMQMKTNN